MTEITITKTGEILKASGAMLGRIEKTGSEWRLTLWGISDSGAPVYRFATTKRDAIAEARWIYEGKQ